MRAAEENPGVVLGVIMGVLARNGRDKVTLVASPAIAPLGAWLEQLLAESTGKDGDGLIPVDREPLGPPEVYGDDRLFVYLRLNAAADAAQTLPSTRCSAPGNRSFASRSRILTLWDRSSSVGKLRPPSRAPCWASIPSISRTWKRPSSKRIS